MITVDVWNYNYYWSNQIMIAVIIGTFAFFFNFKKGQDKIDADKRQDLINNQKEKALALFS